MMFSRCAFWGVLILGCCVSPTLSEDLDAKNKKSEKLQPCQACRNVAKSFEKGIEKTKRGKFEGGDADWEEKKLKSYAYSEVRLVEIQEDLCRDVDRGKDQCHTLVEENEETIEKWWFHEQQTEPNFFNYFCIDKLKVCCPENTFGPNCEPCPGGIESPCNGRGKCQGGGKRKGSGKCKCDEGFDGELCDKCASGFYVASQNETQLLCAACHQSCQNHCWEGGPKGCEVCKEGWVHSPEYGCQDIDECMADLNSCVKDDFCVNVEGSFRCIACHKSCEGCHGDGPDMCTKCREGFALKEGLCMDAESWQRSLHTRISRYVTYGGMTIATFIIFKKNVMVASIVGIAVAVYIAASEYTISENEIDIFPKFA